MSTNLDQFTMAVVIDSETGKPMPKVSVSGGSGGGGGTGNSPITNTGAITNTGTITSSGTVNSSGVITNTGNITNTGTVTASGAVTLGGSVTVTTPSYAVAQSVITTTSTLGVNKTLKSIFLHNPGATATNVILGIVSGQPFMVLALEPNQSSVVELNDMKPTTGITVTVDVGPINATLLSK